MVGISPDRTILAYGGNILGGDTGEPSDDVTVVNLQTGEHATVRLSLDHAQPFRISAVWVTGSDQVYVSAWRQPGNMLRNGAFPGDAVVPRVYRLQAGHWINTGMITPLGAGGLAGGRRDHRGPFHRDNLRSTGDLAPPDTTRIPLATSVTAFAWAPAPYDGPGGDSIPPASPPPLQAAHQVWDRSRPGSHEQRQAGLEADQRLAKRGQHLPA